jgi:N-acetyl-alpha-D-glucosaminyl L-malate synthase BshA
VDIVKHEKLDLLHVHYAIPHATVAYLAKKILLTEGIYIPVITTLHGTDITLVGQNEAFKPVVKFGIEKSDGVTAVSHYLKKETQEVFETKKDIRVIHNFIDFDRFKPIDKNHFKKAIAPNGEKILVHVSNFRKVKRVEDVVRIFEKVYQEIPCKLIMVGDGPDRYNAEQLCRKIGLCHEVRFLGKQDAVEELLAIADLFLMPSGSESFGLAALEAMACEVPVISSNVGGLPEVNVQGVTGYMSDLGNVDEMAKYAIEILKDEATLNKFKANALAQAKQFDIDNIIHFYEDYYEEILETCVYVKEAVEL